METERLLASFETFSSNEQLSDALALVEKLTSQGRRELFSDPRYFPLFFAYYFPEYIKYPFADFHFRMFFDVGRLLRGIIRELAWIMFRESAKTSIAKALIVYLICTEQRRYINVDSYDKGNAENILFDVADSLMSNRSIASRTLLIGQSGAANLRPWVTPRSFRRFRPTAAGAPSCL